MRDLRRSRRLSTPRPGRRRDGGRVSELRALGLAECRAGSRVASVTFSTRGLVLTEHVFSVPLDHATPGGAAIEVFAREVADPDGRDRPFLVFLQGGPGFEASRPT